MLRLDGGVHVVLGAGFGIGYQISQALASVGATVVCVDRDADRAEKVAAEIDGIAWTGDITDRSTMRGLFEFIDERCGRLDGVVDIVGLARYKAMIDLTDDDWDFHEQMVIRHAYLALEYSARYWQRTGTSGSVTFVASVAGMTSSPKTSAYGAYKAALMSLVRTAAVELGPDGIRVNAVAPGVVRTPRQQDNPKWTGELLESNISKTPLRKLAYPSDVAGVLLFLSSQLAGHVTGQSIIVDGGNSTVFNVDVPHP
ncbi:SDR family oxidoreductase [Aeromicrobium sp. YIM 150415]|uniref:SDR family NAD(P)-dependent oxidoreductase n=1 Tax=Aeromicrobium sp. YIM 150415 TaxID=2803912 RepID=UPI0019639BF2|nr:SDR family NAD(P)-dependent oxidoreductase [Aeromicrobium sp. YIM 150415]MBM9464065.1 SDR family oxidoreductase [Aeromicrobium sp. YIM 150415]